MPAFSHFFLKSPSASSKFSPSWMIISDTTPISDRTHASLVKWLESIKLVRFAPMCQARSDGARGTPIPGSTRWPFQRAAAEKVQVKVRDRLSGIAPGVDHRSIAGGRDALGSRNLCREQRDPA